tara:strand:- start:743 stop:1375 length:633 start_codon:yes stop_codon:yes gene_type:complete
MTKKNKPFTSPKSIEYPEFFRPGMGTENIGPLLRALVQMIRPNRVLEIGAGYTTPFLLEGLINNERIFNDGNLNDKYIDQIKFDQKMIVIDDMSMGELLKKPGMKSLFNSQYIEFIEGKFEGISNNLFQKYGEFDFVWFDCGGYEEYQTFFSEYWSICSNYIICHFTYTDNEPNKNMKAITEGALGDIFKIDIIEYHKKRQGSITILKKK